MRHFLFFSSPKTRFIGMYQKEFEGRKFNDLVRIWIAWIAPFRKLERNFIKSIDQFKREKKQFEEKMRKEGKQQVRIFNFNAYRFRQYFVINLNWLKVVSRFCFCWRKSGVECKIETQIFEAFLQSFNIWKVFFDKLMKNIVWKMTMKSTCNLIYFVLNLWSIFSVSMKNDFKRGLRIQNEINICQGKLKMDFVSKSSECLVSSS